MQQQILILKPEIIKDERKLKLYKTLQRLKKKYPEKQLKVNKKGSILRPLKNKITTYDFVGFDVETQGKNNDFLMGGLYWYKGKNKTPIYKSFWDKTEMMKFILENKNSRIFRGKYIVATNIEFDITTLFFNTPYWDKFQVLFSGNKMIAFTEDKTQRTEQEKKNKRKPLNFIDTLNYLPFGVAKLGKILGMDKLKSPSSWEIKYFIKIKPEVTEINKKVGLLKDWKIVNKEELKNYEYDPIVETLIPRKPRTQEEKEELEIYNKRDCKISCDAMYLLQKGFNNLGAELNLTSASTSFNCFRRRFLEKTLIKEEYVLNDVSIKNFIFEGYFGGRTEVFKRGTFKNLYYYDINSLYPRAMQEELPLPQSVKKIDIPTSENINNYEGVSEITIICPSNLDKPVLPVRYEGKLLFPTGKIKGVYNHNEIRKALELGYKIISIDKQIIYTRTFKIFKKFVDVLYNLRKEQKENGDVLEIVTKLLMNSLYGKFGMRKIEEVNITSQEVTRTPKLYNGMCCYPIIASYITSYARLLMYDYVKEESVIYTDTDSVITNKNLGLDSNIMGEMKLEGFFPEGIFIKPKFYYLKNDKKEEIKIKGIPRATKEDIFNIIDGKTINKWKFLRLRSSINRKSKVNKIYVEEKTLSLIENKRLWVSDKWGSYCESMPRCIDNTENYLIERNNRLLEYEGMI